MPPSSTGYLGQFHKSIRRLASIAWAFLSYAVAYASNARIGRRVLFKRHVIVALGLIIGWA